MTNREYLKSCLQSKSNEGDFVRFMLAVQIDACAARKDHYTDVSGNIFPNTKLEWSKWLNEEATITISSVSRMMDELKNKGYEL